MELGKGKKDGNDSVGGLLLKAVVRFGITAVAGLDPSSQSCETVTEAFLEGSRGKHSIQKAVVKSVLREVQADVVESVLREVQADVVESYRRGKRPYLVQSITEQMFPNSKICASIAENVFTNLLLSGQDHRTGVSTDATNAYEAQRHFWGS